MKDPLCELYGIKEEISTVHKEMIVKVSLENLIKDSICQVT